MPESKKITKTDLHQEIKERGWKQGSWLLVNDGNSFGLGFGTYIVVSQDCDLINSSIEKEPFVELVLISKIEKIDSRCIGGKNPRKLHFRHNTKIYECQIKDRFFVDRNCLKDNSPCNESEEETKDLLIEWIIKRYNRTAFPDNFNKRIDKNKKKEIQELLKNYLDDICGLYVQLSTFEELDDRENYAINLYVLVKDETNDQKIAKIADTLQKLVDILETCMIFTEDDYRVIRLSDISYGKILSLYLWDFEYLSYQ
jgi:hypothetical protein